MSTSALPDSSVGRAARLDAVLHELLTSMPELEAAAVVSFDGLAMASALPPGMDEDRVAAMSAALLSLGEKAAAGLGRGDLSQVYVEGVHGTVYLISADDEAVLVLVASAAAKTGLVLFEARRAAHDVGDLLAAPAPPPALTGVADAHLPDAVLRDDALRDEALPAASYVFDELVSPSSPVMIPTNAEWGVMSAPAPALVAPVAVEETSPAPVESTPEQHAGADDGHEPLAPQMTSVSNGVWAPYQPTNHWS